MTILIDTAELAGLAVEGVLYGIFLCLFCVCGYDLANRRGQFRRRLSWPMAAAGVLLILFATARFAVDCANIFTAFIRHDPRTARLGYLQDVKEPLFTTKHCLFIADLLVGDSFVNYRCWVVWGKNFWVIVIPVTFSLISAVSGSYTMWAYTNLPNEAIHTEATWLTVFFSLSLVANAMATSLLAYRIWSIDRRLKNALDTEADQSRLTPIVRIILESGLINAAYLFVMVMTLEFGSEILELMSEMAVPLTGIIFSIVILRVGQQRHDDSFYTTQRPTTFSWAGPQKRVSASNPTATSLTAGGSVGMPLEVYVHDSTTKTRDGSTAHSMANSVEELDV
ncbi:hypothetical protein VTO73DRAFT_51 [Trametes versicolor]